MMIVIILAGIGLLIWAIRAKKYSQALFALVAFGGISAFGVGISTFGFNGTEPGAVLTGIGLAALLGTAVAVKYFYFSND